MIQKKYKVTIIGGTDGFGRWLLDYILLHFKEHVECTITGKNREKGEKVSQSTGVRFLSDNIQAVQSADIVIYAAPISLKQHIIQETLSYIPSGAIVADVTSIKGFPQRALQKREDIIVIPTHPMFGPYIQTIARQVIVLTSEEPHKNTQAYRFLKTFLENEKAKVIEVLQRNMIEGWL